MKRAALFIGINEYESLPGLRCAREDAATLYQLFLREYTPDLVHLLQDACADDVIEKINYIMSELEPGDLFLLYFSGHGIEIQHNHHLLFSKCRKENQKWQDIISTYKLEDLTGKKGVQSIFILDCCRNPERSFAEVPDMDLPHDFQDRALHVKADNGIGIGFAKRSIGMSRSKGKKEILPPAIFCSCSRGEMAFEISQKQHGIFTLALLNVLKNKKNASLDDVTVSVGAAIKSLMEKYHLVGAQNPEIRKNVQTNPVLWGSSPQAFYEYAAAQTQETSSGGSSSASEQDLMQENYRLQLQAKKMIDKINAAGYDRGQTFDEHLDGMKDDFEAADLAWHNKDPYYANKFYRSVISKADWIITNAPLRTTFQQLQRELEPHAAEADQVKAADYAAAACKDAATAAENALKQYEAGDFKSALSSIRAAITGYKDACREARQNALDEFMKCAGTAEKNKQWDQLKKIADKIRIFDPDKAEALVVHADRQARVAQELTAAQTAQTAQDWSAVYDYAVAALKIEPANVEALALKENAAEKKKQLSDKLLQARKAKKAGNWQKTFTHAEAALTIGISTEAQKLKDEADTLLKQLESELSSALKAQEMNNWQILLKHAEKALNIDGANAAAKTLKDAAETTLRQQDELALAEKAQKAKNWRTVCLHAEEALAISVSPEAEVLKKEAETNLRQQNLELSQACEAAKARNWQDVYDHAKAVLAIGVCPEAEAMSAEAEEKLRVLKRELSQVFNAQKLRNWQKVRDHAKAVLKIEANAEIDALKKKAETCLSQQKHELSCAQNAKNIQDWEKVRDHANAVLEIGIDSSADALKKEAEEKIKQEFCDLSRARGTQKIKKILFSRIGIFQGHLLLTSLLVASCIHHFLSQYTNLYSFTLWNSVISIALFTIIAVIGGCIYGVNVRWKLWQWYKHWIAAVSGILLLLIPVNSFFLLNVLSSDIGFIPYGITKIPDGMFRNSSLRSTTVPRSVKHIGKYAFSGCRKLTEITLPDSVETIGEFAFHDCTSLAGIRLPSGLTHIEAGVFKGCTNLTGLQQNKLIIPARVAAIGESAFQNCSAIHRISLPAQLKSIGASAFKGCTGLTEMKIPDQVEFIEKSTFYGCTSLVRVQLSSNLTRIKDNAFRECSNLTELILPELVTAIGDCAFYNCRALSKIHFPSRLQHIGSEAFKLCSSLKKISLPEKLKYIDCKAFFSCSRLTEIDISDSGKIEYMGEDVFINCGPFSNDLLNRLGAVYEKIGTKFAYSEAVKYYKQAAARGNAKAMCHIGLYYHYRKKGKNGNAENNYAEAARYYQMAINHGNVDALDCMGLLYHEGVYGRKTDGKPNYAEAARYYQMAIERGNVAALNRMGLLYQGGYYGRNPDGTPNYAEAARYYQMAIERNNKWAMYNLGYLYYHGKYDRLPDGEPNYDMAEKYYNMAKKNGVDQPYYSSYNEAAGQKNVNRRDNDADDSNDYFSVIFVLILIVGFIIVMVKGK